MNLIVSRKKRTITKEEFELVKEVTKKENESLEVVKASNACFNPLWPEDQYNKEISNEHRNSIQV